VEADDIERSPVEISVELTKTAKIEEMLKQFLKLLKIINLPQKMSKEVLAEAETLTLLLPWRHHSVVQALLSVSKLSFLKQILGKVLCQTSHLVAARRIALLFHQVIHQQLVDQEFRIGWDVKVYQEVVNVNVRKKENVV
jgi:uncharacterized lipoprotein YajG